MVSSTRMMIDQEEHHSISVRKIDNGFVVRKSKSGPKGYKSSETYHDKKPVIDMQAVCYAEPKSDGKTVAALRKAAGNKKVRDT